MSPRAASRLEGLGFERVYDYVPGKADWFASGLPREGRLASVPTIGEAARRDVPTCAPAEKVGAVRERVQRAGWDRCVVVNMERVVLGLLRERALVRPQIPSRGGNEERSCHVSAQRAGWEDG
jgi:hypothetical protein